MISIEKFNIKYLDDVYKIECACFAHPWSKKDLENQLSLDTSHFLVALENEKAVGYMGLQIFPVRVMLQMLPSCPNIADVA